jgi:succinoglycan biosynthesis transport protein ExoP
MSMNYRFEKIDTKVEQPLGFEENIFDFEYMLAVLRRQWRVVFLAVVVSVAFAILYLVTAVPKYTSSASLLIDTGNQQIADQLSTITGVSQDETWVLSQVELLKSDRIARAVSERLDLKDNPTFMTEKLGLFRAVFEAIRNAVSISSWLQDQQAPTPERIQEQIVWALQQDLAVTRVTGTYVLALDYSSVDPQLAAKIAQAFADAYLTDQLDSKYEATRRAGDWLQNRISELREKSLQSDLAVQKFRAEKGLITTDGQLISEQQLQQINSQLVVARSDRSAAEAKYQRIETIINSGDMQSAVSESLDSTVINDLRTKYLEASRKEADIESRLGAKHVQAVRLRTEMSEYQRLMFEELGRIAQSYRSNVEVARNREKNLEEQVASATGVSATANDAQVQLRELEREADTYKKLYETFLQRYQESVQQQSFPVTEARVISAATVADFPSSPKKPLVAALGVFFGLMCGACIGAFREYRDRFFRTGDQIRETLGLEPLGTIPQIKPVPGEAGRPRVSNDDPRLISKENTIANHVIDHPLSAFAETLRSAKIGVDLLIGPKRPKLIGMVSVLPGEGKSTLSINFAELLASQGARVLLIDADLRNPGATRQIGRQAERGILEALQDGVPIRDLVMINPQTKLAFLPAVIKRRVPYSSELLGSDAMERLILEVSDMFDYIIFDLPPLAPVVDARAISSTLDTYLLVVEWGRTARNAVKKTLLGNQAVAMKCAGVILNKVDTEKMKFYHTFGSSEFYYSRYSTYYNE